jgi:hypothetical protein
VRIFPAGHATLKRGYGVPRRARATDVGAVDLDTSVSVMSAELSRVGDDCGGAGENHLEQPVEALLAAFGQERPCHERRQERKSDDDGNQ